LLGATALKGLIDPNAKITQLRGQWIDWKDRLVMPTYHPSALLRNQSLKHPVWEDFKNVVAKYRELVNPEHHSAYC
jgi:DNA polymerase